ncbi:hypothetical protein FPQ18DRAFT_414003 [Pyronema domesticum]|nr:hypothetical protein FPQ18DRAFT_414003 [Pyronema domesticum]
MTRSLLDYGANPNTIFRSGPYRLTPLQMVLGYLEDQDTVAHVGLVGRPIPKEVITNCVSTLLKAGADFSYVWTEKDVNNPILLPNHYPRSQPSIYPLTWLYPYLYPHHPQPHCDRQPIHMAASGGYTEALMMLLVYGVDVHAKSKYNQTPLMLAEWKQHGGKRYMDTANAIRLHIIQKEAIESYTRFMSQQSLIS